MYAADLFHSSQMVFTNQTIVNADHAKLVPTVATVTLQMPASVTEGGDVVVSVYLSGVLEVDLIVTLSATPGTASELAYFASVSGYSFHKKGAPH